MGTLGSRLVQLKPYDPESKGIVERANRYLETSFLPRRSFTSPDDFNAQLQQWLPTANARRVRVLDGRPIDFLEPDRAHMLALPPVPPVVETVTSVRLGRDYYIRVSGNDYSVDPSAIGQLVDVRTTLTRITVSRSGRQLADHDRFPCPKRRDRRPKIASNRGKFTHASSAGRFIGGLARRGVGIDETGLET
jgi:hypothetical protein